MKIGLVQYDMAWEERGENRERIRTILASAGIGTLALDWLIFPEMTLSGFSMNADKTSLAEEDIGFFSTLAREYSLPVTFGGVLEKNNRSLTIGVDGNTACEYSKIHLFSYAGEDKYYKPGSKPHTFVISGVRVTPLVCYDLRFSYLFWNRAEETDVYVVIASWPATRIQHWRALLLARAIENQAYVIGVNRVGADPNVGYNGNSLVIDPLGNIQLDCGDREGLFTFEIDTQVVAQTRGKFPFSHDRRE